MKITILAAPKKFEERTAILQENAINSWIRLVGKENICLFGDDETKINSEKLKIQFQKPITNESGLPLLDSIFNLARKKFKSDYFLYINSDIILLDDFIETANILYNHFKKGFFAVGRRTNLDIEERLDFTLPDTAKLLKYQAQESGKLIGISAIDYFLFPSWAFQKIPPLRIGRAGFDNILIYWAKKHEKIAVIDGTENILAIHQNHDYSHVPGGVMEIFRGKDAEENLKMVGCREKMFLMSECDYKIAGKKILKNHDWRYYLSKRYLLEVLPALYPILYPFVIIRKQIVRVRKLVNTLI